jgi:hypothetical protein
MSATAVRFCATALQSTTISAGSTSMKHRGVPLAQTGYLSLIGDTIAG